MVFTLGIKHVKFVVTDKTTNKKSIYILFFNFLENFSYLYHWCHCSVNRCEEQNFQCIKYIKFSNFSDWSNFVKFKLSLCAHNYSAILRSVTKAVFPYNFVCNFLHTKLWLSIRIGPIKLIFSFFLFFCSLFLSVGAF